MFGFFPTVRARCTRSHSALFRLLLNIVYIILDRKVPSLASSSIMQLARLQLCAVPRSIVQLSGMSLREGTQVTAVLLLKVTFNVVLLFCRELLAA